jgi:hypothetical protein
MDDHYYGAATFMPELSTEVFTQSRTNLRNFSRPRERIPALFQLDQGL